jgi:hypothetical protein
MKYRGINYDIGTKTLKGGLTRPVFDIDTVARELEIIQSVLHCNAIRISGLDIDRIVVASEIALSLGLTVWFSPSLHYDNQQNTYRYILQSAMQAEKLRSKYEQVILVIACELSLFTEGFVQGKTGEERMRNLFGPLSLLKNFTGFKRSYNRRLNSFLFRLVPEIRANFHGEITYAAGLWEKVDWKLFDIVGIDHYRALYNKKTYLQQLQSYKENGKPLAITEFGCCTYQGADDKGAMAWAIVDWSLTKPRLKGNFIRDENVQANYLIELLNMFETENILGAFVFTFCSYNYYFKEDPAYDLDMAAFGIVKSIPENITGYRDRLPWLPKKAFYELGKYYSGSV